MEEIRITTPCGVIRAKEIDFGIELSLNNDNGPVSCYMEYDSVAKEVHLTRYSKEDPYGDPLEVTVISHEKYTCATNIEGVRFHMKQKIFYSDKELFSIENMAERTEKIVLFLSVNEKMEANASEYHAKCRTNAEFTAWEWKSNDFRNLSSDFFDGWLSGTEHTDVVSSDYDQNVFLTFIRLWGNYEILHPTGDEWIATSMREYKNEELKDLLIAWSREYNRNPSDSDSDEVDFFQKKIENLFLWGDES